MPALKWDEQKEHFYETGVRHGVLYIDDEDREDEHTKYGKAVVWNGLTAVTESPSGAEATPLYADDIKYLNLISTEDFGCTIEAYTYPDEFALCDGSFEIKPGVFISQQDRLHFGFAYRTTMGNDDKGNSYGYKLHLIYDCLAAPSERAYATINDSPEAITFSWEISTTPVPVANHKNAAHLEIDSTKCDPDCLAELELILFGSDEEGSTEPYLPLPDEVKDIMTPEEPDDLEGDPEAS